MCRSGMQGYKIILAGVYLDVAKCNLGKVYKLKPVLPAVFLICASNLRGGHPWNLKGRITCAWLRANTVDHCLPFFADSFSRCELLQINSGFAKFFEQIFVDSGPIPSHPLVVKVGKYGKW